MAASSPTDGQLIEAINCFICQETIRRAKVLPCSHTYCVPCLQSHINSTVINRGTPQICFPCPVCMSDTTPPDTAVNVEDWARQFSGNSRETSISDEDEETVGEKFCCFCIKWNRKSLAKSFCQECQRFMCKMCEEHHIEILSHKVIDLSTENSSDIGIANLNAIEKCPKHRTKSIEFFCEDHSSLCCSQCGFLVHRKCENIKQIDDIIETFDTKAKSKDLEDDIRKIEHHMKELTSKIKENRDNIKQDKLSFIHKIKSLREELNTKLQKLEEDLIASLDAFHKDEDLTLKNQEVKGQSLISMINSDMSQINLVMTHGSDVQKVIMLHNIENNQNRYNKAISEYQEDIQYLKMELEVNKNLTDLINDLTTFGNITVTRSKPNLSPNPAADRIHLKDRKAVKISEFSVDETGDSLCCFISDIVLLKGGTLICIDWNNEKIKMFGENYQLQDSMKIQGNPNNACILPDNTMAVTIPDSKTILIISITDKMYKVKEIRTRLRCWGIAMMKDQFVITTGRDQHSIMLLDINGTEIRTFQPNNIQCEELLSPYYVNVHKPENITYITYQNINRLVAYNTSWNVVFTYTHQDMNEPRGTDNDREGNIYLCGFSSSNVQQIAADGKLIKTMITKKDQKRPFAIKFYSEIDRFCVTYKDCNIVEVYDM